MNFSLKKTIAVILISGLELLKNLLLKQIPPEWQEVRATIALEFERIKQMVSIFSDDNPKNEEQVKELLKDIFQQDTSKILQLAISAGIAKIKDDNARKLALSFSKPVILSVIALTDDNPDNKTQIRNIFADVLKNPDNTTVVFDELIVPFLNEKVKDNGTRDFLLSFLKNIFVHENTTAVN